MRVEQVPSMTYAGHTVPPRTFVELDQDDLVLAVRQYVEANGAVVPNGEVAVQQPDHRALAGLRLVVQQQFPSGDFGDE